MAAIEKQTAHPKLRTSLSKPAIKPKPRGLNVRAFIESVERGSKPTPDFFEVSKTGCSSSTKPTIPTKPASLKSRTKQLSPDVITPNTLALTQELSTTDTHTPVYATALPVQPSEYSDQVSEICHSEDSGHSTCDLKYSGSVSSNHSSHDQANSHLNSEAEDELLYDAGYSEQEAPLDSNHTEPTSNPTKSSKHYQSSYKYHVPSKLNGTIPRNHAKGKKAAVIGKAVAKGRSTLQRDMLQRDKSPHHDKAASLTRSLQAEVDKITSLDRRTEGESTIENESDVYEYDTDFSDTSWETDGENSADEEEYDAFMSRHSVIESVKEEQVSTSKFYVSINGNQLQHSDEPNETQKLVSLMRGHSSRKEKQAMFKKRLNNIKANFKKSTALRRIVASSSKLNVMSKLVNRFKKPAKPPRDYPLSPNDCTEVENLCISSNSTNRHSVPVLRAASTASSQSSSSSENKCRRTNSNAQSTSTSQSSLTDCSITKRVLPPIEVRQRTSSGSSAGSQSAPPLLPPRRDKSPRLEEDAPPPPPPRSTSQNTEKSLPPSPEDNCHFHLSNSSPALSVYSPKFTKSSKPQPMARSSKPLLSTHSNASRQVSVRQQSSPELPPSRHDSTKSLPVRGDDSTPPVPARRESSKSLVISLTAAEDSMRRKSEIINSARNAQLFRQSSQPATCLISETVHESLEVSFSLSTDEDEDHDAMMEDEPLYQEYNECLKRSFKKRPNESGSTLLRSNGPGSTLWSTTCRVLSTGVLDHMELEEVKLQEAMYEVITSEASYLRSINMLINVFVESPAFSNEDVLSLRDKKVLFSNITAVQQVSARLFTELEKHWKDSVILTSVCEIVYKYAMKEFDVYVKYCSNQAFQDRTLKALGHNKLFVEALNMLERSPDCHALSMSSFLLLPMQRITRLPLLVDAILRRLEVWSDQGSAVQKCYEQLKKVVKKCNEGAKRMEQTEQVLKIENSLNFKKIKKVPLVSASRMLVKSGELLYLNTDGTKSTSSLLKVKPSNLILYLFNDLLLITKKKGDSYTVLDYASRVNVEVESWSMDALTDPRLALMANKSSAKFPFLLVLLENHQKKHAEYLFTCCTETERTRWTDVFTHQLREDDADKVYESWDCPQVQVTHSYPAQEHDEFDLEVGEIVNILRKTTDGWYEGERVSDGRTGWLPSSYTVELQTDHVRARHLRERYKLLQAASKLQNKIK